MSSEKKSSIKNEIFTVPNILVYIRIILIPVFAVLYINAKTTRDYYVALGVMAIAFLTDFFDGKIARAFNCVTELGKTIDPIADKLYQFSVALCLMMKYPLAVSLAIILFVKEMSMGVMGLVLINKGGKIFGARWYGKVCTAIIDISLLLLLVFPVFEINVSSAVTSTIIYVCDAVLIVVSVVYTRLFAEKIKALD